MEVDNDVYQTLFLPTVYIILTLWIIWGIYYLSLLICACYRDIGSEPDEGTEIEEV